jgi:hypothetical protein
MLLSKAMEMVDRSGLHSISYGITRVVERVEFVSDVVSLHLDGVSVWCFEPSHGSGWSIR